MTSGGYPTAKGLDPRAREIVEDLARAAGLTTAEWLQRMLTNEGPEDATSQDYFSTASHRPYLEMPRTRGEPARIEASGHPADEVGHVAAALDRLTRRIEAAETRSTLAIGGIEQSVRGAIARLDDRERESIAVAARFEGAVDELKENQAKNEARLRRIEQEAAGPKSAEALRALEGALGKVAGHLYESETRTMSALSDVRARIERNEREGSPEQAQLVDSVVARIAERVESAEAQTSTALRDLQSAFVALDGRLRSVESGSNDTQSAAETEKRLEALAENLTRQVESARSEMAERIAASTDGRFDRIERTLNEMSGHVRTAEQRSAQALEHMGREVVTMAETLSRRVQQVEAQSHDSIEQVGGQVARIAQAVESKLNRADSVQAQALEKLGGEIARITERLAERIANAERRNAQAIDEVGEQVSRVTERVAQRSEQATIELTDRIRQSEERTARLLEEAREKIDQRLKETRTPEPAPAPQSRYTAEDYSPFAGDPFAAYQPAAPAAATPNLPATVEDPFAAQGFTRAALEEPEPAPPVPGFPTAPRAIAEAVAAAPVAFAQEDFDAADGFEATDTFLPESAAPSYAPASSPAAHAAFAEDAYDADDYAPASDAFAAPAPFTASAPFAPSETFRSETFTDDGYEPTPPPPAIAADDDYQVRDPFEPIHPEPRARAEAPLLTTREVIERARAAARASAHPDPRAARPAEPQPEPEAPAAGGGLFSGFGSGRRPRRSGSPLSTAMLVLAVAAGSSLAAAGALTVFGNGSAPLPAKVAEMIEMGRTRAEVKTAEADTTPATRPSAGPRVAVAISPTPLTPAAAQEAEYARAYSAAYASLARGDRTAVTEIRRLANLGHAAAQFSLAKLYETGTNGVRTDAVEATRWYARAAQAGDRKAMHNLGLAFMEGSGVEKNLTVGAGWFRRAADLGLVDSQYNLGQVYEHGMGVTQNPAEAYKWYLIASRAGDSDARASLERLRAQLTPQARTAAERSAAAFRAPGVTGGPAAQAPAAAAQVTTAAPSVSTVGDVQLAQRALSRLGYYQGPTDGAVSPALRMAIAAYQRDQHMSPSGAADPATLARLSQFAN